MPPDIDSIISKINSSTVSEYDTKCKELLSLLDEWWTCFSWVKNGFQDLNNFFEEVQKKTNNNWTRKYNSTLGGGGYVNGDLNKGYRFWIAFQETSGSTFPRHIRFSIWSGMGDERNFNLSNASGYGLKREEAFPIKYASKTKINEQLERARKAITRIRVNELEITAEKRHHEGTSLKIPLKETVGLSFTGVAESIFIAVNTSKEINLPEIVARQRSGATPQLGQKEAGTPISVSQLEKAKQERTAQWKPRPTEW